MITSPQYLDQKRDYISRHLFEDPAVLVGILRLFHPMLRDDELSEWIRNYMETAPNDERSGRTIYQGEFNYIEEYLKDTESLFSEGRAPITEKASLRQISKDLKRGEMTRSRLEKTAERTANIVPKWTIQADYRVLLSDDGELNGRDTRRKNDLLRELSAGPVEETPEAPEPEVETQGTEHDDPKGGDTAAVTVTFPNGLGQATMMEEEGVPYYLLTLSNGPSIMLSEGDLDVMLKRIGILRRIYQDGEMFQ